jgi:single-stranded DNA-binding protein
MGETAHKKALVAGFSVAHNYKVGENEQTSFFRCEAYERIAELVRDNLEKGTRVQVRGRMVINEKDGKYYPKIIVERVAVLAQMDFGKKENNKEEA